MEPKLNAMEKMCQDLGVCLQVLADPLSLLLSLPHSAIMLLLPLPKKCNKCYQNFLQKSQIVSLDRPHAHTFLLYRLLCPELVFFLQIPTFPVLNDRAAVFSGEAAPALHSGSLFLSDIHVSPTVNQFHKASASMEWASMDTRLWAQAKHHRQVLMPLFVSLENSSISRFVGFLSFSLSFLLKL